MPGRHHATLGRRSRLRWLIGLAGGAAIAATAIGITSGTAGATGDPVTATFGVTGVAANNCKVSAGGTDVYVKPGQELDVKSSIAGLILNGVPLDLSQLASLDGALIIDPNSANPKRLNITNTVQKLFLPAGNHGWKWTVSSVKVLGLPVPLHLSSSALKAGGKLTWTGTIHVTDAAANCGLAVQLPSVSASVSASGLPPIGVGIPGVKVTVPASIPTSLPTGNLPGTGGKSGGHTGGHSTPPAANNPVPVPARVVPGADGSGLLGGGAAGGQPVGPVAGGSDPLAGAPAGPAGAASSTSTQLPEQASSGKHKTIDLAANRPAATGQIWVVLAIVAVIALAFVAATYARLYLLKRGS